MSNLTTRRTALKAIGVALLGATKNARTAETSGDAIIDGHLHIASSRSTAETRSPRPYPPFDLLREPDGAERLARMIEAELSAAGVVQALCMPTMALGDDDPLGIGPTLKQAALVKGVKLHPVGIAHPERFDADHLERVEEVLKQGRVKALKAYLGYLHYGPTDPGYRRYYRLAAKYDVPVIFHTGDTYSDKAKVKFAHPLAVDEIAVDFPDTKFVLAHFGNPWTLDAAQVVYKNRNVWAELSAFLIGDADAFATMTADGVVERTARRVQQAIEFVETHERFYFGSDWPLAPIAAYRDVVRQFFPSELHAAVFRDNARRLFKL